MVSKTSKKVQNMQRNPNKTYFSINDESFPYKGVKGKSSSKDIRRYIKEYKDNGKDKPEVSWITEKYAAN